MIIRIFGKEEYFFVEALTRRANQSLRMRDCPWRRLLGAPHSTLRNIARPIGQGVRHGVADSRQFIG